MSENLFPLTDHPSQPGWLEAGEDVFDEKRKADLVARFPEHSPEQINELVGLIGRLSLVVDRRRLQYEESTIGFLQLNERERRRYRQLADNATAVGRYVHWFSTFGDAFYQHIPHDDAPKKLGLEIVGARLGGDWEHSRAPGGLDEVIESIPHRINESGKETQIDIHYSRSAIRAYEFEPHFVSPHTFENGIVKRKRSVADIWIADSPQPLKIFKISWALLRLAELSPKERVAVERSAMATQTENKAIVSRAQAEMNEITGRIFEREITTPEGTTREILPLGAQYVMFKDRPSLVA